MGTRADFYLKKQDELTWLGSIAWDGYEIGKVAKSKTEQQFIDNLNEFLAERRDATIPSQGWPWPWDNSKLTDECWLFNCDDNSMYRAFEYEGDYKDNTTPYLFLKGVKQPKFDEEKQDFIKPKKYLSVIMPDMAAIKNVNMGSRSGLLVISG